MTESREGSAFLRAVALPAAITLLVLAAIVGSVLHFASTQVDALALNRQTMRVKVAVEEALKTVAVDQEASTYWDDAVVRTRQRPLDLGWLDNNLGVWFHTYYQIDEAYLLDERGAPVYAMQHGRRTPPPSFNRVAVPALQLAARLRKQLQVSPLAADGSPDGKTVSASALDVVNGRPALISLKPIVAETGNVRQARGSEYLHVAVRYLDGNFLDRLSTLHVADQPYFSWTKAGRASVALRTADGRILGYVAWTAFEPGAQVERRLLPALIAALLVVGLLIAVLLWRIARSRSELEASRAEAQHLAFHDSLTGLPNRALFEDRLKVALSRRSAHVAVLMLDLDRFKNVNDTLGHPAGDALIREFGARLSKLTRGSDTIARLGGDEFAILIEGACLTEVERLATRVLEDVRRPFELPGAHAHVGTSIGVAVAAGSGADPLDLMRQADIALYRAKDEGRNTYRLFSADMDESVRLRSSIEEELREALSSGRGLALHYQPEVNSEGHVIGVEALLRWHNAERGLITPDQFISVAEESGQIGRLGKWVLREACLASRRWPGLFVAVNLSPAQFHSSAFFDELMRIVRETDADPRMIQLEITERVFLDDDAVGAILAKLRDTGFRIVLDDFGTGYSSLSYLRKFPVDKIKIDGSFVQHLADSEDSRTIVSAVLALGHAMGVTVAAEGVETADQLDMLRAAGCHEMQGHYFSQAVPEEEVAPLLRTSLGKSAAA